MTVITHARRKSKLSKMIDAAGGISVFTALTQAQAELEPLRARSLEEVARQIEFLAAARPPAPEEDAQARLEQLYRTANAVIDAAGPFDMDEVCAAASGLCDLIDAASPERPFDWRLPPIYAGSLSLLLALPAAAKAERAQVRASLNDLVARKLAQAG